MIRQSWKTLYVRLMRSGNWLLMPMHSFAIALPLYYEWKIEVPPVERLYRQEGELTYRLINGKQGTMVGLKTPTGAQLFTYRNGENNHHPIRGGYVMVNSPVLPSVGSLIYATIFMVCMPWGIAPVLRRKYEK